MARLAATVFLPAFPESASTEDARPDYVFVTVKQ